MRHLPALLIRNPASAIRSVGSGWKRAPVCRPARSAQRFACVHSRTRKDKHTLWQDSAPSTAVVRALHLSNVARCAFAIPRRPASVLDRNLAHTSRLETARVELSKPDPLLETSAGGFHSPD